MATVFVGEEIGPCWKGIRKSVRATLNRFAREIDPTVQYAYELDEKGLEKLLNRTQAATCRLSRKDLKSLVPKLQRALYIKSHNGKSNSGTHRH